MRDTHGVRTVRESGLIQSIGLILDRIKKKEQLGNSEAINLLVKHLTSQTDSITKTTQGLFDAATTLVDELVLEFNLERDAIISIVAEELRKRYRISQKAYTKLSEAKTLKVPLSIFTAKAGVLETLALYLRDQLGLSFTEIGQTLSRDPTTIWTAYHKALKKEVTTKELEQGEAAIPLSIFGKNNLTMFESVVAYLKEKEMKFVEIGQLLERDQRNIWSTHARALKKLNESRRDDPTKKGPQGSDTELNKKEETKPHGA